MNQYETYYQGLSVSVKTSVPCMLNTGTHVHPCYIQPTFGCNLFCVKFRAFANCLISGPDVH